MQYKLSDLAKRANPNSRRAGFFLPEVIPTATSATNLYRSAYKPVIDIWTNNAPRILDAYKRTISDNITDSAEDIRQVIDEANSAVMSILPLLSNNVRDWALGVGDYVDRKWRGAILSACKVDVNTLLGPEALRAPISTILEWNVALISDVSTQAQQRISSAVFSGVNQRVPAREIAKQISDAVGMGRDRALRIASDQVSKLTGALAEERQREAGITEVEWVHSRKKHPRNWHQARNGKVYYLETKKAVEGTEVVPPDDWVQQPPYCGCRTRAWVDLS